MVIGRSFDATVDVATTHGPCDEEMALAPGGWCNFTHMRILLPHCLGFVSGLMLVIFGGLAGWFLLMHREHGIWMLGVITLLAHVPLFLTLEYDCYRMNRNPRQPAFYLRLVDTVIGANVVRQTVLFLAIVTWFNWNWSRQ